MLNSTVLAYTVVLFMIVMVALMLCSKTRPAEAQTLGTKYTWIDSLHVTVTKGDTILPIRYEQCSMWFVGCNGLVKIGGESDTTEFASRYWLPLEAGQVLSAGPADRLKRLWFKAAADSGTLWIIGYKNFPQW